MSNTMIGPIPKDESYAERRALFKGIWDTAIQMGSEREGSVDESVTSKPKVIKTLHLDEIDKSIGRKKKQRIKNLRSVCNKILDFCNRQENEECRYAQITAAAKAKPITIIQPAEPTPTASKQKNACQKKSKGSPKKKISRCCSSPKHTKDLHANTDVFQNKTAEDTSTKVIETVKSNDNSNEGIELHKYEIKAPQSWKRLSNNAIAKINKKAAAAGRSKNAVAPRKIRKRKAPRTVSSFSFSGRRRTRNPRKKIKNITETADSESKEDIFGGSTSKKTFIPVMSV